MMESGRARVFRCSSASSKALRHGERRDSAATCTLTEFDCDWRRLPWPGRGSDTGVAWPARHGTARLERLEVSLRGPAGLAQQQPALAEATGQGGREG